MKSIKINRSGLKGGLATRRTDNAYRKNHDQIKKVCGCTFGEKCGSNCKAATVPSNAGAGS